MIPEAQQVAHGAQTFLGAVDIAPSREALRDTNRTVEALGAIFDRVAEEFNSHYDEKKPFLTAVVDRIFRVDLTLALTPL